MRLKVREDAALDDIAIDIACPSIDHRVRRIVGAVEMENLRLVGVQNGYQRMLPAGDVLYAESVDGRTFLYTKDEVVESSLGLGELESRLAQTEFIRAARPMLVNLAHVEGLRPYLNARLELVLDNGERVVASRQFAPQIKKRIGL